MGLPKLGVDLNFEAFSVSAEVPLEPVVKWWEGFKQRRRMDRLSERRQPVAVRLVCPACGADFLFLTAIIEEGEYVRACRKCHHRFETEQ